MSNNSVLKSKEFATVPILVKDRDNIERETYEATSSASFKDFMFKKEIMQAIGDCGFEHPSKVQHAAIPDTLLGHDMIVQAKSGMGKTAIFVLCTLNQIQPSIGIVDTLILTHTREMAVQIFNEFERFAKYMLDVHIGIVYGGIPYSESKRIIESEKPHILCATPGRIIHLLETNILSLRQLKRFIVDECDNMQEYEMRKQIQTIFKQTPHNKQVLMYSATIQEQARAVCRKFTRNAKEIFVDDRELTLYGMQQYYVAVSDKDKTRKLFDLLDSIDFKQCVIFVKTQIRTTVLNKILQQNGFPSVGIHGDMNQFERLHLFQRFKTYEFRILVSTNLFGRGIDLERVNVVINYDMTQTTDEYLHRVGRAGRFGTKGLAISLQSNQEEQLIMEQIQQRFKVKVMTLPKEMDMLLAV